MVLEQESNDLLVLGFGPPPLHDHLLVVAGVLGYNEDGLSNPVKCPLGTIPHLPQPEL